MTYGKAVHRLTNVWRKEGIYAQWAVDIYERNYLEDREAAYQMIAAAYTKAGLVAPPRTILSGE